MVALLADTASSGWADAHVVLDVIGAIGVVFIVILIIGAIPMIPDFFRYMRLKSM